MVLTKRFQEAMVYACELHARQKRKGSSVPYIAHLLGTTSIALEFGANEDEAIAALLHDAIEDQGGDNTRQDIKKRFGETVVMIVNGCTDSDTFFKPPWRLRKEAYLAHLQDASPSVCLVSASDKLHNARSILQDYRQLGEKLWSRFNGGREGTLWYYQNLVETFRCRVPQGLALELEKTVRDIEFIIEKERSG
jgi:(p)ppGpp synthase/HD superfamily hydrolase